MWYRAVVDSIEGDQVHAQPSMKAIKVYIGPPVMPLVGPLTYHLIFRVIDESGVHLGRIRPTCYMCMISI